MDKLLNKAKHNIIDKKLIKDGDVIILGLSAGPDSVFLLYCLVMLKDDFEKIGIEYKVILTHVNHGIRDEAINDENIAIMYSEKYNLPIYIEHKNVGELAKELKISEEECGRDIRYSFFNKIKGENDASKIAVAHNSNDNAETVMFNFLRGTGVAGLSGMEYISSAGLIRPILNIKKEEILNFLDENKIQYAIDKTNNENKYTRNKIRNQFIKQIESEYNPNIVETINRMAEILTLDKNIIDEYVDKIHQNIILEQKKGYIKIDRNEFRKANSGAKGYIIRKIVTEVAHDIKGLEYVHINDIIKLLDNGTTGKKFIIGNKFEVIIEKKDKATFVKK